jgi:hypothetical protein
MSKNHLQHLTKVQIDEFFDALNFMNMEEIKHFCNKHGISISGKKGHILDRLKHYLITGEILHPKKIPPISKAKVGEIYLLKPNVLILKGAYKNDFQTRRFFKKLVGEHFHFTAFGQDWISKRWEQGKPPTYNEFAKAWQKEYLKRKKIKANPKKEWAYLNFMQQFLANYPNALKKELAIAWEEERNKQAKKAMKILNKIKISRNK